MPDFQAMAGILESRDTHTPPATPPASSDLAMLLHDRLRATRTGSSPPSLLPLPFPLPLAAMLTRRRCGAPLCGAPARLPDAAAALERCSKQASAGAPQRQRLAQGKAGESRTAALAGCGPWRRPRPRKTAPASVRRSACLAEMACLAPSVCALTLDGASKVGLGSGLGAGLQCCGPACGA